jgi:SAM-dependent methyltransferase
MTAVLNPSRRSVVAAEGVYVPQEDSHLLIETLTRSTTVVGRRALDLCTGSGVVAIAAAELGAAEVSAWDISPRAVRCATANAEAAGVSVRVRLGSIGDALRHGRTRSSRVLSRRSTHSDASACHPTSLPAVRDLLADSRNRQQFSSATCTPCGPHNA